MVAARERMAADERTAALATGRAQGLEEASVGPGQGVGGIRGGGVGEEADAHARPMRQSAFADDEEFQQ
jgi:hypothetical protein